eukprot:gene5568-210_t
MRSGRHRPFTPGKWRVTDTPNDFTPQGLGWLSSVQQHDGAMPHLVLFWCQTPGQQTDPK